MHVLITWMLELWASNLYLASVLAGISPGVRYRA